MVQSSAQLCFISSHVSQQWVTSPHGACLLLRRLIGFWIFLGCFLLDAGSMACLFPRGSLRTVLSFLAKSQSFTNFLLVPLYFLRDLKWKIPLIFFDYDTYVYIIKSLPTLGSNWGSSSSLHPCGLRVIINGTSFCSPGFFQFGQYTILSPLLVSLHAVILAHLSSTLCSPVFIPAGEESQVSLHS